MIGISDYIAEYICEFLTEDCQTMVSTSDPTYVDTIKVGALKADPSTRTGNHIMIHFHNPTGQGDQQWYDTIVQLPSRWEHNILRGTSGVDMAEVGGGTYWWRRFTVEVRSHFADKNFDEDEARQYHLALFHRVRESLRTHYVSGEDDFGETVVDIGGSIRWEQKAQTGEGKTWIWRSFIGLEYLTRG